MITLKLIIENSAGDRAVGTEIPTTIAKSDELIKNFITSWFPKATDDTGWITRNSEVQRLFNIGGGMKIIWIKRNMH